MIFFFQNGFAMSDLLTGSLSAADNKTRLRMVTWRNERQRSSGDLALEWTVIYIVYIVHTENVYYIQ